MEYTAAPLSANQAQPLPISRTASGVVVTRIEAILESILLRFSRGQAASVNLDKKRRGHGNPETVYFPGRSPREARKFGTVI